MRSTPLAVAASILVALSSLVGSDRVGPLEWSGHAEVFTHPTLPGDRVLTATLRNDGLHPLRVDPNRPKVDQSPPMD